jgi:PRD1 phage membrane DNA delivery
MTDQIFTSIVTIATAIIGVAILAVLVSKQAQTPQVIQAGAVGFAQDLYAAVSPLSSFAGGAPNLTYPTQ